MLISFHLINIPGRVRVVATNGGVIPARILRAIPCRPVARVAVAKPVSEVIAKKYAAKAEYGAAAESAELPVEARIEVATAEVPTFATPMPTLISEHRWR